MDGGNNLSRRQEKHTQNFSGEISRKTVTWKTKECTGEWLSDESSKIELLVWCAWCWPTILSYGYLWCQSRWIAWSYWQNVGFGIRNAKCLWFYYKILTPEYVALGSLFIWNLLAFKTNYSLASLWHSISSNSESRFLCAERSTTLVGWLGVRAPLFRILDRGQVHTLAILLSGEKGNISAIAQIKPGLP